MNPQMQNKANPRGSIQSVLRSYGGPSQQSSEHKDQLKQQLLRSEFFAEPADTSVSRGVVFSWGALTRRLALVSAPAVAFILILAVVVANYSPLTAQQVLAKAADQVAAASSGGPVHYTKRNVETYFSGITDNYNTTTQEFWENTETQENRWRLVTKNGVVLNDYALIGGIAYTDPTAKNIVEGPIFEPGGALEELAMRNAPTTGGGSDEVEQHTFAACAEGFPDCNDVIVEEVPQDSYDVPNKEALSKLYSIESITNPEERKAVFMELAASNVLAIDRLTWRNHEVYSITYTLQQGSGEYGTFYFDRGDFRLVGSEFYSPRFLMGPELGDSRTIMEIVEETFSTDPGGLNPAGLMPLGAPGSIEHSSNFTDSGAPATEPPLPQQP
jgi:hypothetical protein